MCILALRSYLSMICRVRGCTGKTTLYLRCVFDHFEYSVQFSDHPFRRAVKKLKKYWVANPCFDPEAGLRSRSRFWYWGIDHGITNEINLLLVKPHLRSWLLACSLVVKIIAQRIFYDPVDLFRHGHIAGSDTRFHVRLHQCRVFGCYGNMPWWKLHRPQRVQDPGGWPLTPVQTLP